MKTGRKNDREKIYYVWIGNAKKPDIFYKCLKSWQEKLPDFEIIEINEKNFDIEGHLKKTDFSENVMRENSGHICLTI